MNSRIGEQSCCKAAQSSSISPSAPAVRTDAEVLGFHDRMVEEGRLANPWVAVHHEDGAVAAPCSDQQSLEHRLLALPAEQPPGPGAGDHLDGMSLGSRTKDFLDSPNCWHGKHDIRCRP